MIIIVLNKNMHLCLFEYDLYLDMDNLFYVDVDYVMNEQHMTFIKKIFHYKEIFVIHFYQFTATLIGYVENQNVYIS